MDTTKTRRPTTKSTLWKRRLGSLWRIRRQSSALPSQSEPRILVYHSIGIEKHSLPMDLFEMEMRFLKERANVISLETALNGGKLDGPFTCAITFDDGYASVHRNALAVLEKYGFQATVYVTTGLIGETTSLPSNADAGLFPGLEMMTWHQIRALQKSVFTIGSHLVRHLDLRNLSHDEAIDELTTSRLEILKHTNEPCVDFAYPWGLANSRCAEWVREAGYRSGCTTHHSTVHPNGYRMLVPRVNIENGYDMEDFEAILRGDWDFLSSFHGVKAWLGRAKPSFATADDSAAA
jgi:peptidoglycan/xylan/chitin deacetylase (PgdA/CDA1 family)